MLKSKLRFLLGFLLPFFMAIPFACWAQLSQLDPSTPLKYYEHRSWEEIDGERIERVFDIDQDDKGYIWLATNKGLLRFDSSKIESYNFKNVPNLRTETIRFVEVGKDNLIWFATRRGLYCIKDKEAFEVTNPDGSSISRVFSMETDWEGVLHFTLFQEKKLYRLEDGVPEEVKQAGEGITKVMEGANGKLLCLGYSNNEGRIVVIHRNSRLVVKNMSPELRSKVISLSEGPFGEFYGATASNGLVKIEDDTFSYIIPEYQNSEIRGLMVDASGAVFYSTGTGLYRYFRGVNDVFTTEQGLTYNDVRKVFLDRDGNLWVGTMNGLNYFSKGPFTNYPPRNKDLNTRFECVWQFNDGTVIVGSRAHGLFQLEGEELVVTNIGTSLGRKINSLTPANSSNELYMSTEKGVFLLQKENDGLGLKEQLSDINSGALIQRSNGEVWLSHKKSKTNQYVDTETVQVYKPDGRKMSVNALEELFILDFHEDFDNVLWIFTSKGLFKYKDNQDYALEKVPELESYWMTSKAVDENNRLWVGTLGTGLHLIANDTIQKFDTRNGLTANQVMELLYSEEGGLWMHFSDVDKKMERLLPYEDNGIQKIGVGEYYTFKQFYDNPNSRPASIAAQDGSFLLAGSDGLIRFNPKDIFYRQPRVRFDRLVVDNETFSKGDELVFDSEYDDFEFHYSAVDFTRGESQIFEVKLEGLDEDWKSVGKRQVVYYSRLPAGKYTFNVRLITPEFGRIEVELPVQIEKKEVWYLRTNVVVFFSVLLLLLAYALVQFRINDIKKQRANLEMKVEERTAELNDLNQHLEETVAERTKEIYKINEELTANEERYKYALDASTDGIWDWDVVNDEIKYSPAIYTMLGYKPYEFPQTRGAVYAHIKSEEVRRKHKEYHERIRKEAEDGMLLDEYRMTGKYGNVVFVQVKGKVVERDEKGAPARIVGTHVDITKEKEKTKEILDAVLNTEFVERSRISKDLHDGLQQTLTISSLNFQWVKKDISKLTEKGKEKFEQGWKYLQSSIEEARSVAHSLMPKAVLDYGVISAYESLIDEIDRAMEGTRFNFYHNFDEDKLENQQVEIILYRILQEALNNIAKYADAKTVTIQLKDYKDIYMLTIEDDGVGFDMERMRDQGKGLGFRSMQNRLDAINGFLEIESMPGRGTTILVEINK